MSEYALDSSAGNFNTQLQNPDLSGGITTTCQRKVVRCRRCLLVQFCTISGLCRRCAEPLAPRPQPDLSDLRPARAAGNRNTIPTTSAPSSPHRNVRRHDPELRNKITRKLALGQTLRELRESKNLTQQQVASKAGVPRTYVSRVEHSHLLPGTAMVHRLADALAVGIMDLFPNKSPNKNTDNNDSDHPEEPFWNSFARYFGQLREEQQARIVYRVRAMLCERLQQQYRSGIPLRSPHIRAQKSVSLSHAYH